MSSSAAKIPSEKDVKDGVWKLMDKAGRHPKLTARMVRNQLEKTLTVPKDSLKSFRPLIKKVVFHWWVETEKDFGLDTSKEGDSQTVFALGQLMSVAKAAGKFPAVLKGVPDEPEKKVAELRKRLRQYGLEFSDVPTPNEINKIKKTREKQIEMDGIDQSLVVDKPRRREGSESDKPSSSSSSSSSSAKSSSSGSDTKAGGGVNVGDKNKDKNSNSSSSSSNNNNEAAVKKRRIIDDDDEAEF